MKTLSEIIYGLNPLKLVGDANVVVSGVQSDSRKVEAGFLFVATCGTTVDGHDFISDTLSRGAAAVVCERLPEVLADGVTYVLVEDSNEALGRVASAWFGCPSKSLKLVGVTGTNGKTTTKELIREVLSVKYKVTATEGNLNNSIGVPLTLLKINSEISCHDVRMVPGVTHTNLIFDIVKPFSCTESDDELKNRIMKAILERTKNVYCVITVDTPFL